MKITANALVRDSGLPDAIARDARQMAVPGPARGDAAVPARQPLLRDRQAVGHRVGPLRQRTDRMGPRAGDLRLRAQPHHVRVRTCADDALGARGVLRPHRRVPRLHAPRRRVLPLHEHPRALLHRLPGRHRDAAAVRAHGLRRMVRGVPRRTLAHVRRAQQHAAHRPRADRARTRRVRRRAFATHSAPTRWRASASGRTKRLRADRCPTVDTARQARDQRYARRPNLQAHGLRRWH